MIKKLIFVAILLISGNIEPCGASENDINPQIQACLLQKASELCVGRISQKAAQREQDNELNRYLLAVKRLQASDEQISAAFAQALRDADTDVAHTYGRKKESKLWLVVGGVVVVGMVAALLYWYLSKPSGSGLPTRSYVLRTNNGQQVRILLVHGDITQQQFARPGSAAIVNAANQQLAQGGGVCGAIFEAAGPRRLRAECQNIHSAAGIRCLPGGAVITSGCDLAPVHIIHAVGPHGSNMNRSQVLQLAYTNTLNIADQHNITEIAIPALSTGLFGYPLNEATGVAFDAVINYFNQQRSGINTIRFVGTDPNNYRVYEQEMNDRNVISLQN